MKLFVNDKPVNIIQLDRNNYQQYDGILNGKGEIISKNLIGNILVEDAAPGHIDRLFKLLEVKKLKKLTSITFAVEDKEFVIDFIKDQFKVIKAAGGIVQKGDKVLLIYRMDKWDLPKGKFEKGEDPEHCAKREVEEECNIEVALREKLCKTWHTYIRSGRRILKKTHWYVMDIVDDSRMKPQIKEMIEDVRWMDDAEVKRALKNSYNSVQAVFDQYYLEQD